MTNTEQEFLHQYDIAKWLKADSELHEESLRKLILDKMEADYKAKEEGPGADIQRIFEKQRMLEILDSHWKDHLGAMDYLRQSIGLRGYAQKNPEQEYKRESFEMFSQMLESIKYEVIVDLSQVTLRPIEEIEAMQHQQHELPDGMQFNHAESHMLSKPEEDEVPAQDEGGVEKAKPFVRGAKKVGRNEPCPCGSGKKYKQCCGKVT